MQDKKSLFILLNEIIHHLIYILVSVSNFKCNILQKQNQFQVKITTDFFRGSSGLEALEGIP